MTGVHDSAEGVARSFLAALDEGRWNDAAALVHPQTREAFKRWWVDQLRRGGLAAAQEIDPESEVVVICHHGNRSMHVALFLERNGFGSVHNLAGGVDLWAKTVDPSMPVY